MDALYAQAAYCTAGEERARALLESIRAMAAAAEGDNKWVLMAASLCQQAVFELETHAIVVDGRIEAGDVLDVTPYRCQPLETLEALEEGFSVLFAGGDLWSPFIKAVRRGDATMVDLLILAGMDPAAEDDRAIRVASENGHLPVVNRLLQDERVNPAASANYAIRVASKRGYLPVVEMLLQDARVDPATGDNWAIRAAFENNRLPVVERLLQDERVSSTLTNEQLALFQSKLSQLSQ